MKQNYDDIIATANAKAVAKKIVEPIKSQLTMPDVVSKTLPAMRFKQTNTIPLTPFALPEMKVAKVTPVTPYQLPMQQTDLQPYQFALPKQDFTPAKIAQVNQDPYSATNIAPFAVAPLELPQTPPDPIKEITNFGNAVATFSYKKWWDSMGASVGNQIESTIPLVINTAQQFFKQSLIGGNAPSKALFDTLHQATGRKEFDLEGMIKSAVDPIKQKVYDDQQRRMNTVAQRYAGQAESGFQKNVIGVSTGILDMSPMIIGNIVAPGSGLAIMFGQVAESEYRTALKDGASEEQAGIYGVLKGAIEVGTEYLSGGVSMGGMQGLTDVVGLKKWIASGVGGMLEKSLAKVATTEIGKKFVSQAVDIFSEGGEEYLSQVLGDMVVGVYKKQDKTLWQSMTSQEAWDATVMGWMTSAVMSGGAYAGGKTLQTVAKGTKLAKLSVDENLSLAQTLVKTFGADLVMVNESDNRNGSFVAGKDGAKDTIYINQNGRGAMATVALHEVGHLLINSAENGKEVVNNFLSIYYDGKSIQKDFTKLAVKYQNFYDLELTMDKHNMTKPELDSLSDVAYADLVAETVKDFAKDRRTVTQDELLEELFTTTMEKVIDDASGMRRLVGQPKVSDKIRSMLGEIGAKLAGDENAVVVRQMQDIFNMYADGYKESKMIEQQQRTDFLKQQMQPQTQLGRLLAKENNVPSPQMASLAKETQKPSKITVDSKSSSEGLKTSQAKDKFSIADFDSTDRIAIPKITSKPFSEEFQPQLKARESALADLVENHEAVLIKDGDFNIVVSPSLFGSKYQATIYYGEKLQGDGQYNEAKELVKRFSKDAEVVTVINKYETIAEPKSAKATMDKHNQVLAENKHLAKYSIEDFGKKIGGARKDLVSAGKINTDSIDKMNERELNSMVNKASVLGKPDYKQMVKDGVDPAVALYIKGVRDSLAVKPEFQPSQDKAVISKQYVQTLTDIDNMLKQVKTKADAMGLYQKMMFDGGYVEKDGRFIKPTDKGHATAGIINNKLFKALQLSDWTFARMQVEVEKTKFGTDLQLPAGYEVRKFKGEETFSLLKGRYIIATGFVTETDAINSLNSGSVAKPKPTNGKIKIEEPVIINIKRTGVDYRKGKQITGKHYLDEFGFSGGEFGNWENQIDRQTSLNYGYDGLHDLANTLKIMPKSISFGGTLSIAFGARGVKSAKAHYEPLRKVINLTKMKGAGSLAHEWFHGLDDYIGTLSGLSGSYAGTNVTLASDIGMDRIKREGEKLSPELISAYDKLIKTTQYKMATQTVEERKVQIDRELTRYTNNIKYLTMDYGIVKNEKNIGKYFPEAVEIMQKGDQKGLDRLVAIVKDNTGKVIPKSILDQIQNNMRFVRIVSDQLNDPIKAKQTKTDFLKHSEYTDGNAQGGSGHGYWSSTKEMLARSFSTYLQDRMGIRSDYLEGGHGNALYNQGDSRFNVFPEGEELDAINEAFDGFFEALKKDNILIPNPNALDLKKNVVDESSDSEGIFTETQVEPAMVEQTIFSEEIQQVAQLEAETGIPVDQMQFELGDEIKPQQTKMKFSLADYDLPKLRTKYELSELDQATLDSISEKTKANVENHRNNDITSMVSVDVLNKFKEYDRMERPFGDANYVNKLADSITKEGINEPLFIEYNPNTGFVRLGEGNHRLGIANLLGITEVPVIAMRNLSMEQHADEGFYIDPNTIKPIQDDETGTYYASYLKPSELSDIFNAKELKTDYTDTIFQDLKKKQSKYLDDVDMYNRIKRTVNGNDVISSSKLSDEFKEFMWQEYSADRWNVGKSKDLAKGYRAWKKMKLDEYMPSVNAYNELQTKIDDIQKEAKANTEYDAVKDKIKAALEARKDPKFMLSDDQVANLEHQYSVKAQYKPIIDEMIKSFPDDIKITDRGLEINVVRYQKSAQDGQLANRNGVFYMSDAQTKKDGNMYAGNEKTRYGGNDKFEGKIVAKRPLLIEGRTGGEIPVEVSNLYAKKTNNPSLMSELANKMDRIYKSIGIKFEYPQDDIVSVITDYTDLTKVQATTYAEELKNVYVVTKTNGNIYLDPNYVTLAIKEFISAEFAKKMGYDVTIGYEKNENWVKVGKEEIQQAKGYVANVKVNFNDIINKLHEAGIDISIQKTDDLTFQQYFKELSKIEDQRTNGKIKNKELKDSLDAKYNLLIRYWNSYTMINDYTDYINDANKGYKLTITPTEIIDNRELTYPSKTKESLVDPRFVKKVEVVDAKFSIDDDIKRKTTPVEVKFPELTVPQSYDDASAGWKKYVKKYADVDSTLIESARTEIMKDSKKLPTKEQWLSIARKAGENLNPKNAKALEAYAFKTWFDKMPSYKGNYNRQGESQYNARFGINEWVKEVYIGAGVADTTPQVKSRFERLKAAELTIDRAMTIKQEVADRIKSDKEASLAWMNPEQRTAYDKSLSMTDAEREALYQKQLAEKGSADQTDAKMFADMQAKSMEGLPIPHFDPAKDDIMVWMEENAYMPEAEMNYESEPAPEGALSTVDPMAEQIQPVVENQAPQAQTEATEPVEVAAPITEEQAIADMKQNYPDVVKYLEEYEAMRQQVTQEAVKEKSDRQKKLDAVKAMRQIPQNARNITDAEVKIETRSHQQTVAESGVVADTMKSRIRKEMEAGDYEYEVFSDKSALENADATIKSQGIDLEYSKFIAKVAVGHERINKDDIAIAERLIQELSKQKGQWQKVDELIQYLAIAGTEAGQTVQAMSLINKLGTYGQMMTLDKIARRIESHYAENKGNKRKKKTLTITINETLRENLINADPSDTKGIKDAVTAIQQNIADQIPAQFADKVNAWRYISMLGNFRTHGRNIVGNATAVPLVWGRDAIGTVLEKSLKENERTKAIILPRIIATKEGKAILAYATENYAEMSKLMNHSSKYDMNTDIEQKKTIFKTIWLEKLRVWNFSWLEKEDMWFKKYHYVRTMAEYMTAKGLTADTITSTQLQEAQNHGISEALKMTYQDASKFASMMNQIERNGGTLMKVAIGSVLPFKKTPVNILKRGVEFSPVALVTIVPAQFMDYRKGNITQAKLIDSLSAGLTGTGIALLGGWLFQAGILSMGNDDDEKKNAFDEMMGKQNFSINVGDMNFTIDWAIPTVMPLFVGAQIAKIANTKGLSLFDPNVWQPALTSVFNPVFEMSMLQGVTGMLKSYNKTGAGTVADLITNSLESYAGQFVPTLSGQIARIIDQTRRSTYAPAGSKITPVFESFLRRMASKIPLASFLNAPLVNAKGVDLKQNDNIILRAFETLISPAYSASTKVSPEDKELIELFDITKDSSVLPRTAAKTFTKDGTKYILNNQEYAAFAKTMGTVSYDLLKKLTQSDTYKILTANDKISLVNDLYEYARGKAQAEYLAGKKMAITDKAYLKIYAAEGYGVSAVDYALAKFTFDSLGGAIDKKGAFITRLVDRGYNYEKVKYLLTTIGGYTITDKDYTMLKERLKARK